jgi:phosphomannomutase
MVASAMLARHPGATILYNLICSKAVPEVIAEGGGTGIRTRVGHSFIKKVMGESGAVFGGEHSGHYYFRDNFRADSGIITAMVVLEMLSAADAPLSRLVEPFERYADSGEINTEVSDPSSVVELLASIAESAGAAVDRLDGATIDHGDWWYNVRPSNTEPLLRLNVEAKTPDECASRVKEVLASIERAQER